MASPVSIALVALLAVGVGFTLVAVVGLFRLPDVYTRAHATSKSETLGALLALTAAAVAFGGSTTTVKIGALALFLLMTSPAAAHAIVRSADDQGIAPWTRDESVDGPSNDAVSADSTLGGEDDRGSDSWGEGT
jgi:multicomponent Na+:H+ antiporter subunit G